jgi:fucose permease
LNKTLSPVAADRQRRRLLVGLAYVAFISLGLPDGLIGVGWPSIRATFGLPLDALGGLLVTFTIGYLLSSFSSGRVLGRIGVGMLLVLSCLATACSLLGYGLAPAWGMIVTLGALSGLGAGAIDAGLNAYAAHHFDARTVNWLHASFGVGSTTGPFIMTSVLAAGQPWRLGFVIVGSVQLCLALCFALTRRSWEDGADTPDAPAARGAPLVTTLALPVAWLGIAFFFVYTGIELAAGQWMYSLLTEARGLPPGVAGLWVSIYWGSLTVGRVLFGVVAGRVRLQRALMICMLCLALGAALVWLNLATWLSFLGFSLMGLSLAPLFPSMISTTPERMSPDHVANAVGFQVAAAALGGAAIPSLVGVAARAQGLEVLGILLFGAALALIGLFLALRAVAWPARAVNSHEDTKT